MQARCPNCKWEPVEDSEWACESCGYHWQVFETAGRCPQCKHQQQNVYCIEWQGGCGIESELLDWFEDLDEGLSGLNIQRSGS